MEFLQSDIKIPFVVEEVDELLLNVFSPVVIAVCYSKVFAVITRYEALVPVSDKSKESQ